MTKVKQEILRILDFTEEHWPTAWKEAASKEKLTNTYMLVNGQVAYVNAFDLEENKVLCLFDENGANKWVDVDTLDVFLPDTGLYQKGEYALFVEKYPYKQWKKSAHDSFYGTIWVRREAEENYFFFLSGATPTKFFVCELSGKVYCGSKIVGLFNKIEGTINMTNKDFYIDVEQWIKKEKLPWILLQQ